MKEARAYRCLQSQEVISDSFALRTIQDDDIEDIRNWRNDQIDVLRQSELISPAQQREYFEQAIWPTMELERPANILLTFFEKGRRIGYGGLVHISWEHCRAELSFLLDTEISKDIKKRKSYFSVYLKMIKRFAFDTVELSKLTTETYDIRPDYIQALQENGFAFEGRLRRHVLINGEYIDSVCHAAFQQNEQRPVFKGNSKHNILVSSAGKKIPLISAIKSAAKRMPRVPLVMAGDVCSSVHAKYFADGFVHLPPTDRENIQSIMALCDSNDIKLIIPTRDGELDFWAQNRAEFERSGTEILVSEPQAIAICVDKLAFAEFGQLNQLPVTPAWEKPMGSGPFVVKERYGAGSRLIGLNLSEDDAKAHAKRLSHPIFQPFIEGREISVDAWLDRCHRVKGLVLRERNEVANGESVVTTTFKDPSLESECVRVLESLALRGPVVLQLVIDQAGHPQIIELNARFGGASTASISAGLDIWYWTLLELDGQDLDAIPFHRSEVEVRQIRVPQDVVLYDPDI